MRVIVRVGLLFFLAPPLSLSLSRFFGQHDTTTMSNVEEVGGCMTYRGYTPGSEVYRLGIGREATSTSAVASRMLTVRRYRYLTFCGKIKVLNEISRELFNNLLNNVDSH